MAAGSTPPPKPWEQAGASSSGPAPFRPSTPGSTSGVVEASGTAKPGEIVSSANRTETVSAADRNVVNRNALGRTVPSRPWESNYGNSHGSSYGGTYGGSGYNSGLNYGYGSGTGMGSYGSYNNGIGGAYGGGMYGNNMYRGGYGGGMYSGSGMYNGGGMYNGVGGPMGGYGMGGPYADGDPNNPYGPPSPPGFWMSFIRVMSGVVDFFGRISILIEQNTHAFHMLMSALLQLFDRSGMLYGELARFVLRLLGIRTRARKSQPPIPGGPPGHPGQMHIEGPAQQQKFIEGPKAGWDNVWGEGGSKAE